jgi:hypothetical protein
VTQNETTHKGRQALAAATSNNCREPSEERCKVSLAYERICRYRICDAQKFTENCNLTTGGGKWPVPRLGSVFCEYGCSTSVYNTIVELVVIFFSLKLSDASSAHVSRDKRKSLEGWTCARDAFGSGAARLKCLFCRV